VKPPHKLLQERVAARKNEPPPPPQPPPVTADEKRDAAAALRAIALQLAHCQEELQQIATMFKRPEKVTDHYLQALSASLQTFTALKHANALANELDSSATAEQENLP
jgi:hypothetical protein